MPTVAVYNAQGVRTGEIELSENVFGQEVRADLMHQVVKQYLANQRQGTHSVKNRSAVSGGGAKPWRQKGTGRARQGSRRAPNWPGGGIVFGPQPRDYGFKIPKKVKRAALQSALSSKVADEAMIVLDELAMDAPKTKTVLNILNNLKVDKKALIVTSGTSDNVYKSTRNVVGVDALNADSINVYELLNHEVLVVTKDAVSFIEEVYA
jgi:large subunit ribosomal protein L4